MKNSKNNLYASALLAILYNLLFWDEYLGINTLIFFLIFISTLYFFNRENCKGLPLFAVFIGSLITALFVVFHNSLISKFVHVLSVIVLVGLIHFPTIRSLMLVFLTALSGVFTVFGQLIQSWNLITENSKFSKRLFRSIKLFIIPILVLTIFYMIFIFANEKFGQLSLSFWNIIFQNFSFIIEKISFFRIVALCYTFFLIAALVYKSEFLKFVSIDNSSHDNLFRTRNAEARFSNLIGLKLEYRIALLLVGSVNILLFVVNYIDINWIWIGFEASSDINLSQFVHEGTYLLILSIVLSMAIILYFFRLNINFLQKNKSLKLLCYLWIFQNAILCISVALRNYHYIAEFGLAYKRIGVIIFLIITLFGLFTLILKIKKVKSSYFLIRSNAWCLYVIMIISCAINWDCFIATYNLEIHKKTKDLEFLLTLSEKTTPILMKHKVLFSVANKNENEESMELKLLQKEKDLYDRIEKNSWLSWNYADYQAYNEMKNVRTIK